MAAAPEKSQESRSRGTSFPRYSLADVVEIVKSAGNHGKSHSAAALAGYAGHTSHTSGPFGGKLASLRAWGLVIGSNERLTLTDDAIVLAHPPSPEREREALIGSFKQSPLIWKVYQDSAKGRPLDIALIGNSAVANSGVTASAKDAFIKVFIESAVFVGLAERLGRDRVQLLPEPTFEEPSPDHTEEAPTRPGEAGSGSDVFSSAMPADSARRPPAVRQALPVRGGEVLLQITLDGPLPASAYIQIAKVVEELEKLTKILPSAVDSSDVSE